MPTKKYKKTLVSKVALLYLFMNVVSISLFTYIISNNQADLIVDNTRFHAKELMSSILGNLQRTAATGVLSRTGDSISHVEVMRSVLDGVLQKFAVVNDSGEVLLSSQDAVILPPDFKSSALKAASTREFSGNDSYLQVLKEQRLIRFFVPLEEYGFGKSTLFVEMDMTQIGSRYKDLFKLIVLAVFGLTLLHVLFAFVILQMIIRPIRRIYTATSHLASGEYSYKVGLDRNDEIGALADGFDSMGLTIQETVNELNDKVFRLNQAKEQIELMAVTDELTKLYNRYHLFERLQQLMASSVRYGQQLGLVILDVDYFKKINDTMGHAVGDTVLREISRELHRNVRQSDLLARYGGEEIIVLLPQTSIEDCKIAAEKYRKAIERMEIVHADSIRVKVTISLGVVEFQEFSHGRPAREITPEQLIDAADKALYVAKSQGRNCTRLHSKDL